MNMRPCLSSRATALSAMELMVAAGADPAPVYCNRKSQQCTNPECSTATEGRSLVCPQHQDDAYSTFMSNRKGAGAHYKDGAGTLCKLRCV